MTIHAFFSQSLPAVKQAIFGLCVGITATFSAAQTNSPLPASDFSAHLVTAAFPIVGGQIVQLKSSSSFYYGRSFNALDPRSGGLTLPVNAPSIYDYSSSYFGSGSPKKMTLQSGGFITIYYSSGSFESPQPPPSMSISKYDALGRLVSTRGISGTADVYEAPDGRLLLVQKSNATARWFDLTSTDPALNAPVSLAHFCVPISIDCKLSAPVFYAPRHSMVQGGSSFSVLRQTRVSFEQIQFSLLRANTAGELLYETNLQGLTGVSRISIVPQLSGTLLLGAASDFRFFDSNGKEIWRIPSNSVPLTSPIDLQADLDGMTVFARVNDGTRSQMLYRLDSSGLVRWQYRFAGTLTEPPVEANVASDGSVLIYNAKRSSTVNGDFEWIRTDGTRAALPAGLESAAHIEGGGVIAIAKSRSFASGYSINQYQNSGALRTSAEFPRANTLPSAVRLLLKPKNSVDVALSYLARNRTHFVQSGEAGAVQLFEVDNQRGLHFKSADTIFVHTQQNTLAKALPNNRIAWERDLLSDFGYPTLLAVGQALLVTGYNEATNTNSIRVIDRDGLVSANLALPLGEFSELTCYEADFTLTSDYARCLYRAVQNGPIEIYRIDANYQVRLLNVVFRAERVVNLLPNGELLLRSADQILFRASPTGQTRWQISDVTETDRVIGALDGSAWILREPYDAEPSYRQVSPTGNSTAISAAQMQGNTQFAFTLPDASLLLPSANQIRRLQVINGVVNTTAIAIGVTGKREFLSSLTGSGFRTAWVEASQDGTEQASLTTYQWPEPSAIPIFTAEK